MAFSASEGSEGPDESRLLRLKEWRRENRDALDRAGRRLPLLSVTGDGCGDEEAWDISGELGLLIGNLKPLDDRLCDESEVGEFGILDPGVEPWSSPG